MSTTPESTGSARHPTVRPPLRTVSLALPALLLVAACGVSMGGTGGAERNLITRAMIADTDATNAYEAVERLRPQWLTSRGPTSITDPTPTSASVYVDGTAAGGLDYLRSVLAWDVEEIRFWTAGEAANRFGMGHPRGVIEVRRTP